MYKPNKKHLQPLLISNVNDLPEAVRQRLEDSWAGVFYREFFCRIPEAEFAVLYAEVPSRPNTPVNVLVGLETLKAGFGWSDEELYDHFLFDLQVRYALGYQDLKEGHFELRTLYNFRRRLSEYNQTHAVNLIASAFEQITTAQIAALEVQTGMQRMDSTQLASNIVDMSRLQLLVEGIQRLHRQLSPAEQAQYAEWLEPYVSASSGQYVYRVKGKQATQTHLQRVGAVIQRLLSELAGGYGETPVYQVLQRLFAENFKLQASAVQVKDNAEIAAGCLQSLDDQEATFRRKGTAEYKGYVANLTQTCEPANAVQLITKVQVAPNNVEDADLLTDALPDLVARTEIQTLYADGGYGDPDADEQLNAQQVELIQTNFRGRQPDPHKLNLSQFTFTVDEQAHPLTLTCPQGQTVPVEPGRTPGYFAAAFDPFICQTCPYHLQDQCRAKPGKRNPAFKLRFDQHTVNRARRRQRYQLARQSGHNPRAAIEACVRAVKHPFPGGKLPVRGLFRMSCMVIASAAMANVRSIWRSEQQKQAKQRNAHSLGSFLPGLFRHLRLAFSPARVCFSC